MATRWDAILQNRPPNESGMGLAGCASKSYCPGFLGFLGSSHIVQIMAETDFKTRQTAFSGWWKKGRGSKGSKEWMRNRDRIMDKDT